MVLPLAAVLLLTSSSAATVKQSRHLFDQGQADYKAGQFKEAIEAFLAADRLHPSPDLMYDVAQAYERLGELGRAVEYYEAYLQRDPRAKDRAQVSATVANLKGRLAAKDPGLAPVVVLAPEPSAVPLVAAPLVAPPHWAEPKPTPLVAAPEAEARAEGSRGSHPSATAIALGVGSVVAAGFAVAGAIDVASFQGTRSKIANGTAGLSYSSAQGQANAAMGWGIAAIALTVLTAAGVTGTVLTW
jgi:iron complex outermembrane receptor protein